MSCPGTAAMLADTAAAPGPAPTTAAKYREFADDLDTGVRDPRDGQPLGAGAIGAVLLRRAADEIDRLAKLLEDGNQGKENG